MDERRLQGQSPPSSFETLLLHRSGARIAIELAQSRTTLDGRLITVTFVNDISSRTATSQALRESEKRFRDLVDAAPDGVAILRGPVVIQKIASEQRRASGVCSRGVGSTSAPSTARSTSTAKSTR